MPWNPFLMKKLIKNEICGSMNSARMYCSRKNGQKLRLLFMYRTWTVAASGEKTREKKKKKKENAETETQQTQSKHTLNKKKYQNCQFLYMYIYIYVHYDFLFSNEETRNAYATTFWHGGVSNNGQWVIA